MSNSSLGRRRLCVTALFTATLVLSACDSPDSGGAGAKPEASGAPAASGTPSGATIPPADIQRQISSMLTGGGVAVSSVICPAGIPAAQATTFTCTATSATGAAIVVNATLKADGDIHIETPGLLDKSKVTDGLEPNLTTKLGMPVDIQCPKEIVVVHTGGTFTCPAQVGGIAATVDCKATNEQGDVHCDVVGPVVDEGAAVSAKLGGAPGDIQCPKGAKIMHAGATFSCPAQIGGKAATVDCKVTDEQGHVDCNTRAH